MSHHVMADFIVNNDEASGTTVAIDLACNLSESIDCRFDDERDELAKRAIRLAFGALCGAIAGMWGDEFLIANVHKPQCGYDY